MASFYDLPPELVESVASFLWLSEDLCSLRLTCRYFYLSTLRHFRKSRFETVSVDLYLSSLHRLEGLCTRPDLVQNIQRLVIWTKWTAERMVGTKQFWQRYPSGRLIMSQAIIRRWRAVIERLVCCRSFCIYHRTDPPGSYWDPDLTTDDEYEPVWRVSLSVSDIVAIMLSIFSASQIPVLSFALGCGRYSSKSPGHQIDTTRLDPVLLRTANFKYAWSNLTALVLESEIRGSSTVQFATSLVQAATRLRRLTINFDHGHDAVALMEQLSCTDFAFQLEEIHLEAGWLGSGEYLVQFLSKHDRTLWTLSLILIGMRQEAWAPMLKSLTEFRALRAFRLVCPTASEADKKSCVKFSNVEKNCMVDEASGTQFKYRRFWFHESHMTMVSYCGSKMKVVLQTLVDGIEFAPKRELSSMESFKSIDQRRMSVSSMAEAAFEIRASGKYAAGVV
ncbi:hypothetical protein BDV09DRAFT_205473 [Aspergillus tetrazonus]